MRTTSKRALVLAALLLVTGACSKADTWVLWMVVSGPTIERTAHPIEGDLSRQMCEMILTRKATEKLSLAQHGSEIYDDFYCLKAGQTPPGARIVIPRGK